MKRGDVQFTSAGSGITHLETNEYKHHWCHFFDSGCCHERKACTLDIIIKIFRGREEEGVRDDHQSPKRPERSVE